MDMRPIVHIGDVWASCDPRQAGRQMRVVAFENDLAVCVVTVAASTSTSGRTGQITKVQLCRLKPRGSIAGYRLVHAGHRPASDLSPDEVTHRIRQRARTTVYHHAQNADDAAELLAMLGLDDGSLLETALTSPAPAFTNH